MPRFDGEFEAFFKKNQSLVLLTFYKKLWSQDDALDLTQETFLRAYMNWDRCVKESSRLSWVLGISSNVYKNYVRKRVGSLNSFEVCSRSHNTIENVESKDDKCNPFYSLNFQEVEQAVGEVIQRLPDKQKKCIVLLKSGFKYWEIAKLLNLDTSTVKSHICHARRILKKDLKHKVTHHY